MQTGDQQRGRNLSPLWLSYYLIPEPFLAKLFWFLFVLFNVLMLLYALFNIGPMINSWDHPELGRQNRMLFEAGLKLWVWGDVILGMPAILQYLRSK